MPKSYLQEPQISSLLGGDMWSTADRLPGGVKWANGELSGEPSMTFGDSCSRGLASFPPSVPRERTSTRQVQAAYAKIITAMPTPPTSYWAPSTALASGPSTRPACWKVLKSETQASVAPASPEGTALFMAPRDGMSMKA